MVVLADCSCIGNWYSRRSFGWRLEFDFYYCNRFSKYYRSYRNNRFDAKEEAKEAEPDVPTEYKNALIKAQQYSDTMYMSKAGLYDQLTSEYGEQFSEEAAEYAIDNVQADWKANALEKAKQYEEQMSMSPSAIHDQLTSDYGEQFTEEEADYAIENL